MRERELRPTHVDPTCPTRSQSCGCHSSTKCSELLFEAEHSCWVFVTYTHMEAAVRLSVSAGGIEVSLVREAVSLVNGRLETEASGNVDRKSVV